MAEFDPVRATIPLIAGVLVLSNVPVFQRFNAPPESANKKVEGCSAGSKDDVARNTKRALENLNPQSLQSKSSLGKIVGQFSHGVDKEVLLLVPSSSMGAVLDIRLFDALCKLKSVKGVVVCLEGTPLQKAVGEPQNKRLLFYSVQSDVMLSATGGQVVLAKPNGKDFDYANVADCGMSMVTAHRVLLEQKYKKA